MLWHKGLFLSVKILRAFYREGSGIYFAVVFLCQYVLCLPRKTRL